MKRTKKRKILSACLCLEGDELWNNTTIIGNNKFIRCHYSHCCGGSFWAWPKLEIEYSIDNEEFNRTFYVGKSVKDEDFDADCVEKWLNETEIYKKLGMELEVI